tara:strand:- start:1537 stop:1773 length:237 start_codon:yes stop_codon:yes gene_type:complete
VNRCSKECKKENFEKLKGSKTRAHSQLKEVQEMNETVRTSAPASRVISSISSKAAKTLAGWRELSAFSTLTPKKFQKK